MNTRRFMLAGGLVSTLLLVGAGVFIRHASKPIEVVKVYQVPNAQSTVDSKSLPLALFSPVAKEKDVLKADVQRQIDEVDRYIERQNQLRIENSKHRDPFLEESESLDTEIGDLGQNTQSEDDKYAAALNPPTAPTRGLINLLESLPDDATYEEFEARFTDYTLTYYPLTMLEPHEVDLLGPEVKAAYDRQQAASHKEAMDMIKETFGSMPPEILATLPTDMKNLFEKEGVLP